MRTSSVALASDGMTFERYQPAMTLGATDVRSIDECRSSFR
jgi:hypothetical protein